MRGDGRVRRVEGGDGGVQTVPFAFFSVLLPFSFLFFLLSSSYIHQLLSYTVSPYSSTL